MHGGLRLQQTRQSVGVKTNLKLEKLRINYKVEII